MIIQNMDQILHRSGWLLAVSTIGILGYEYLYHKKYSDRQVPLLLGFAAVLCNIAFSISAVWFGATLLFSITGIENHLPLAFGGLFILWLFSISIQLAQNVVRHTMGAKTQKISLINKNAFRFRGRKQND